jgi:recombination protein RecR
MSDSIPRSVQKLIDEFSSLPGIGPKTASRLTFYLLHLPEEEISDFGKALLDLKKNVVTCQSCYNLAENNPCAICSNPKRDQTMIAVVENSLDVIAIEKTSEYQGLYHILGGAISPVDGIGPDELRIKELIDRVKNHRGKIKEIILATNPSLEGEATAMYIMKEISNIKNQPVRLRSGLSRAGVEGQKSKMEDIKITRIARGLPVGGDLEYADEITLSRALEGRKEY